MICTYLLPIRRGDFCAADPRDLAGYFTILQSIGCEVVVIDGSPPAVFRAHAVIWADLCRHQPVDRRFCYLNDKVNAIHTGMRLAATEKVILADDDVRYGANEVYAMCQLLDAAGMVRPQNYISPLPWWGRLEAARMLINRATLPAGDYPGTCAFLRSTFFDAGEYDGDVLFDNEEIVRHFACTGVGIEYALDFLVQKKPPRFRKWMEQRPRQAYEDFPLRAKTFFFASILPVGAMLLLLGGRRALFIFAMAMAIASISVARIGWARGRARLYFPRSIPLWAPLWIFERAFSTYWAAFWWITRGGYPFGDRLLQKGVGRDWFAGAKIASGKRV